MKNKKILWICLAALDIAVVGFLFVVHIMMLANIVGKSPLEIDAIKNGTGLVAFLARNITVYGLAFVLPLFLILVANIIFLVLYLRKNLKHGKISASDLTEEEKEALKKELLKDLQEK